MPNAAIRDHDQNAGPDPLADILFLAVIGLSHPLILTGEKIATEIATGRAETGRDPPG